MLVRILIFSGSFEFIRIIKNKKTGDEGWGRGRTPQRPPSSTANQEPTKGH